MSECKVGKIVSLDATGDAASDPTGTVKLGDQLAACMTEDSGSWEGRRLQREADRNARQRRADRLRIASAIYRDLLCLSLKSVPTELQTWSRLSQQAVVAADALLDALEPVVGEAGGEFPTYASVSAECAREGGEDLGQRS